MLLFGLIILLVGSVGFLVTLTFVIMAIFKNSKYWKLSGISLATTTLAVIALILIQETILYPPNPKIDKLVLSAYREAPIGGIWLGVYNDRTWQLGYSSVEITSEGKYELAGDTLTLFANDGTTVIGDSKRTSFLIEPKYLVEVENSGIRSLEIQLNKLETNGL
ncbi:hypothetical protein [Reichenbachiella ulvae]|uniref:Uncharacterized protein n=1 Tax=Reichenbachiella ulvae TaxID=2980104 RepID=A0ABT3CTF8_9BACT|nr:hypothetical protein [Reichenbachiella ulvae]MCV9386991.1 hypothetical protein [Reichenbachiella ulvae]